MNSLKISCIIIGFLLITMTSTDVFSSNENDPSYCPIRMIQAILTSHPETIQSFLEDGVDPNTSLNSCHLEVSSEGTVIISPNENSNIRSIIFWTMLPEEVIRNSSLIHLAEKMRAADPRDDMDIYNRKIEVSKLLTKYGLEAQ